MPLTRDQLESRRAFLLAKDFLAGDERRELAGIERDLAALPPDVPTAPRASIPELLATPAPFRAWLEGLAPDAPAGIAVRCDDCPLARFLGSQGHGADCAPSSIVTDDGPTITPPAWTGAFIRAVDELGKGHRVTPAEALRLLAQAEG